MARITRGAAATGKGNDQPGQGAVQATTDKAGLQELLDKVAGYNPQANVELLTRAFSFGEQAHRGQYRDSGDAFFHHPVEVAKILADLEMDVVTLSAGLLHDVLEDCDVTPGELEAEFGAEVRLLVDGVTKLSRIPFRTKEEHQAESLRKMLLAMAQDLRVIVIKLADRLHNMRTLHYLPPERRRRIATETMDIYTPLAHRLGMWAIKWEMEDLGLRYLRPEAYEDLVRRVKAKHAEREGELEEVMAALRRHLEEVDIAADIHGRPKHLYSIYHKMEEQERELGEIYDLVAVRVVVDTVKDCYGVLGLVHTLWKPVPGRFKDFIAMPKSNMYQSLHTTVIGPRGEPLEIQIRTWEMHRIAEKGIAAHWLYKEGYRTSQDFEEKVAWLRQVMEWLKEMNDPQEFMETLKIDLFEDEVFVFTPKGDVKSLPAGSTPIDFAFSVHTDIGMHCVGAKVNGRMVSLDYKLSNGEFVEVLTAKNATPSQDWLGLVKTSKARNKIRSWLKEERREESTARGREVLEREMKRLGLEPKDVLRSERLGDVIRRYGFVDADDLMASVGFGQVTASQMLSRILGREEYEELRRQMRKAQQKATTRRQRPQQGVRVKGVDNLLVRFSKCCNPVPGDPILGYITRGRGVSVHREDCPNTVALNADGDRHINVQWDVSEKGTFPVEIEVEAVDRVNLLTNIMTTVSDEGTNIEAVNARTTRHKMAVINLIVDIDDLAHMNNVMNRIKKVKGVLTVHRAHPS